MLLIVLSGLLTGLVMVKLLDILVPGLVEFFIGYLALFCHFLVIDSSQVVLVGKSRHEYGVNVGVPQGFIYLVVLFFYHTLMILFLILLFMLTVILTAPNLTFQTV